LRVITGYIEAEHHFRHGDIILILFAGHRGWSLAWNVGVRQIVGDPGITREMPAKMPTPKRAR